MREAAIQKLLDRRDYWQDKHAAAYAKGDLAYQLANQELGSLLAPFERLTGMVWWSRGGFQRPNPRREQ